MGERSSDLWRTAAGLGAIVAGGVIVAGAFPGYAGAAVVQAQATPSTSVVEGNATCAQLAPEGASWVEFKVEPVTDGEHSDGTLTVTIDVTDTDDGPVFDWTSNLGVDAVFVKGGPGGLLYVYDPPAESTGDTGLHAPVNPQNGQFYGLSHLSFCYDADQATTTTSEQDTTTTTSQETTTTTEATTTTAGDTSTTTAQVEATTPTTTAAAAGELPKTGNNSLPLLVVGAGLLCGGTALVAATRWLRHS
jgi:LPXTG-motif cell wall-anchored protein